MVRVRPCGLEVKTATGIGGILELGSYRTWSLELPRRMAALDRHVWILCIRLLKVLAEGGRLLMRRRVALLWVIFRE